MLSRVADAVYWMERYRERAENTARLVDVNLYLSLDMPDPASRQWAPVIETTGDVELFKSLYGEASEESVMEFLTFDTRNPNSILSCLLKSRENARSIREIIPSEMWHEINTTYLFVRNASENRNITISPHQFYNRIKRQCQLFTGIANATMSRNDAWHFGRLGYLLERADKTARILDVKYYIILPSVEDVGTPYDNILWNALLKSASAFEMYRKRWRQIDPPRVVDFLILNHEFPRAIYYCVSQAEESLLTLSGTSPGSFSNEAERIIGPLRSKLSYIEVKEIIQTGLHEFLNDLLRQLDRVSSQITGKFFSCVP